MIVVISQPDVALGALNVQSTATVNGNLAVFALGVNVTLSIVSMLIWKGSSDR